MVRRWSRYGQGMVKGGQGSGVKSECSPQKGQRAVDLQGVGDCGRALVADLVVIETDITGKGSTLSRDGQGTVKRWSRARV
eukprot:4824464-Prymnesium_polylepis.1